MNSDQLLNALADCAKASTHEPDAETINAAMEYIMQLERENHNQDLTIDEKNERIAQLEAQLAEAERDAWNAAIAAAADFCNVNALCFYDGKTSLCDEKEFGEGHQHDGKIYSAALLNLKK